LPNKLPPFKILLLEDEKPARDHLAAAIDSHPELNLVDSVANCADAITSLQKNQPDVLVSDLGLPDGNGVKVIQQAKSLYPDI
jgi:DNA-binding NarL/FixJ family response regulator